MIPMIPTAMDIRRLSWPWSRVSSDLIPQHHNRHHSNHDDQSLLNGELSDGRWQDRSLVEIPKGYLPVYVGTELKRFVIPMEYLSMPDFRILMEKAEEEFGFDQEGGLKIPCDEQDFLEVLFKCLARQKLVSKTKKTK
ncbi:hypothetical protein Droror1_Dr00007655 [Drosera rotundifolia]